jgi:hypothetical protein
MQHEMKIAFDDETRTFGIIDSIKKIFTPKLDKDMVSANIIDMLIAGGMEYNIWKIPDLGFLEGHLHGDEAFLICFPIIYSDDSSDQILESYLDKDERKLVSDTRRLLSQMSREYSPSKIMSKGTLVYDYEDMKRTAAQTGDKKLKLAIEDNAYRQAYVYDDYYCCLVEKKGNKHVVVQMGCIIDKMVKNLKFPEASVLEVVEGSSLVTEHLGNRKNRKLFIEGVYEEYNKLRKRRGLPSVPTPDGVDVLGVPYTVGDIFHAGRNLFQ